MRFDLPTAAQHRLTESDVGGWAIIPEIRVFDVGMEWGLMHSDSN
jgi:hypothetical protein